MRDAAFEEPRKERLRAFARRNFGSAAWHTVSQAGCTKTGFIRFEACGAHACLPKLRASAAGGFGPPTSATSSHTACSTASCRIIWTQLAKGRDGYEAGLRGAKLRPADGLRHRHSDMQSPVQPAAERRDLHKPFGEMQLSANGRLRAAAHMCEFADGTKAIRRCRPPLGTADGTRRSNGVPRQDGITRSIDCSVFLFGQRHKSPSREPRYGFRLFAMIFKTSLAELYRA